MVLPSREEIRLTNYYIMGEIQKQPGRASFALYAPKKRKRFCYCFDSVADDVDRLKLHEGSCVTISGELAERVKYDPKDTNKESPTYYEIVRIKDIFISGPAYEKNTTTANNDKEDVQSVKTPSDNIGFD